MLVLSLLGNVVVCCRLLTSRRKRLLKAQVLFLNLALADLLVTLVTMNSQLLWEMMDRVWIAGDIFCRLFKVLQTYALVSSTYMLVGIAVDRHFAICNPLAPAPKPLSLAAACWLISLAPSLPNLFVFRLVAVRDKHYCASIFYIYPDYVPVRRVYMAFVFAAVFLLPLFALVALYAHVLLRMWKMATCSPEPFNTHAVVPRVESTRNTLPKVRVRTLKMAVVISVAFLVTNLPYMVQEMLLAFAQHVSLGEHTVAVFGVMSASNSAINPYIYLAFNGGAGSAMCDARMRGMWRRLTRSSECKRTTVTFRSQRSTLRTASKKRMPATGRQPPQNDREKRENKESAEENC
ncbi:arg8-vasotocin receptor-like [Amblyomma americanum]